MLFYKKQVIVWHTEVRETAIKIIAKTFTTIVSYLPK